MQSEIYKGDLLEERKDHEKAQRELADMQQRAQLSKKQEHNKLMTQDAHTEVKPQKKLKTSREVIART